MSWMSPVNSLLCVRLPSDAHPDDSRDALVILQMYRRRLDVSLDVNLVLQMSLAENGQGRVVTPVAMEMVWKPLWGGAPPDVHRL